MASLVKRILLLPLKALRLASRAVQRVRGDQAAVYLPIAGLDADVRALILMSLREAAQTPEVRMSSTSTPAPRQTLSLTLKRVQACELRQSMLAAS